MRTDPEKNKTPLSIKHILRTKGVNFWYLVSAMALNLFWTYIGSLSISLAFLQRSGGNENWMPILLLVAAFAGPFLIGWMIGRLAGDNRGPTYGLYGSLGSAVLLAVASLQFGLMGIMLITASIAGGLNGGLLSLRRRHRE